MIGIYKITSPSERVYIGQSIQIETRWRQHSKDYNDCPLIRNSIKKYGFENHIFEVLLELKSNDHLMLDYWELFFVNYFKSNGVSLMNVKEPGTGGRRLIPVSEDTKKKISEAHKGKPSKRKGMKASPELRAKMRAGHKRKPQNFDCIKKTVGQYNLKGNLIRVWPSATDASTALKDINKASICTCCKKLSYKHGGFYWRKYKEYPNKIEIVPNNLYKTPLIQMTTGGELVREWDSLYRAAKESNMLESSIKRVLRGNRKSYKGFIWKYKSNG